MAGTSKYKAMYEEAAGDRDTWKEAAQERGAKITAIEAILFGLEKSGFPRSDNQDRDVVVGVRSLKADASHLRGKTSAQATELARAWHMIRVFSEDRTLSIESAALMKALDEGKIRDFNSVFSPEQTGL